MLLAIFTSSAREFALLLNTLQLVAWVELGALPVAFVLAWLLTRTNLAARSSWQLAMGSLLFVPLYLHLCGWDAAFGVLGWFTLSRTPRVEPLLSGFRAAVVVHTLYAIPWATWLMAALFQSGRREFEEQALLEGEASQVWRLVSLPQCTSGLLVAALVIFILTSGEMTVTNIYLVRTYAENVYSHFAGNGALEAVMPHLAGLLLFSAALAWFTCGALLLAPYLNFAPEPYRWRLKTSRRFWFACTLSCVAVLMLFPLLNLMNNAGTQAILTEGLPHRVWSFAKLFEILALAPRKFAAEFQATLLIASAVSLVALSLGSGWAWCTRDRPRLTSVTWFLSALGLSLPGPVVGLSVVQLMNQPQGAWCIWLYDRTIVPPVLALLTRGLPIAYLGSWWCWRTLDAETLAAAQLDGATAWQQFRYVAWPQGRRLLSMLGVMILALASGDLATSLLTLPPGISTLSQRMFGLIHSGVNDQVAGIAIWSWGLYFLAGWAMRWRTASSA
jgi:iron(III) transport system permease protein